MLGMKTYPQDYIDGCRAEVTRQLRLYRNLSAPPADFAAAYFGDLVIVLDACFTHRLRGVEGKDGNALNEVRILAQSLMRDRTVVDDTSIRMKPETSVLGLTVGDPVTIGEDDFVRLSDAFFAELQKKFGE